ncbi:transketolase family protein [Campylobacter hyointestinalis]|uniref:1-deoxy-D-xylulose-5-phosphate synthase n=1 Tax=Campylobacter hyointestinalis subsp. lawsonii TaxID=91353 RepID=A0AAV6EEK7_CAMHY|nr:transketolase [Campylobacter hyointestinalis]KAB0612167.1 transketolase [Campylobacter hyointestinalis subsp. lawsonii]QKF69431.1 transketolase [Campylobacter hyointestinalis subsp. lawsonii]RAZ27317.1 transketolase [Campylobacter hyointestinalis subsp. lawsonii]
MKSNLTMRDAFFINLYEEMSKNENIYLITADFGAPMLDKIRESFNKRAINIGIAEQNAINIAAGLALEGKCVYVYGIAPFISMRPFEQLRINLSALSSLRNINVNIISVGAGVSYSISGPTHHCLEDLSLIRTLPNFEIFSPSDSELVNRYFKHTIEIKRPKYLRFDATALLNLEYDAYDINDGFRVKKSKKSNIAIISTGYMSQKAYEISKEYDIELIDIYSINSNQNDKLIEYINRYEHIITLEEGFINCGGLDSYINFYIKNKNIINLGFAKKYTFDIGDREFIHSLNHIGFKDIKDILNSLS